MAEDLNNINGIFQANPEAGTISINTSELKVFNGARIEAVNNVGNSGNIDINAQNIELNGTKPTVGNFIGGISTSTNATSIGNGGDISINTGSLKVLNGSIIRAISLGSGDAGKITVNAKTLEISGFDRFASEPIEPQRVSKINTGAQFNNGGDLFIDSDSIVVKNLGRIESSSNGDGGNININSDVILGLEPRSQLTAFSDITASSEFGISGTIKLNSPNDFVDDETLVTIENLEFDSTEELIKQSCFGQNRSPNSSRIIDSGRAGIPESPDNYFDGGEPIGYLGHRQVRINSDKQPSSLTNSDNQGNAYLVQDWHRGDPIIEANAVRINSNGSPSLVHINSMKSIQEQVCQGD